MTKNECYTVQFETMGLVNTIFDSQVTGVVGELRIKNVAGSVIFELFHADHALLSLLC